MRKIFYSIAFAAIAMVAFAASARADYISPRPMFGPTVVYQDYGRPHRYAPRRHVRDNYYRQHRPAHASGYYRYERRAAYGNRGGYGTSRYNGYGPTAPRDNNAAKQAAAEGKCENELALREAAGWNSRIVYRGGGCTVTSAIRESGSIRDQMGARW